MAESLQHKALVVENFGRFGTARELVEKILAVDYTNNSSLLELTTFGGYFGGLLIVHQICQSFVPPKFCPVR